MKLLTTIPFQGFYESVHTWALEREEGSICADYDTGNISDETIEYFYSHLHYKQEHFFQYAKIYVESLSEEIGINLEIENMDSPREYNFATDRIFCHIAQADIERMLKEARATVEQCARDKFTSRDGFHSYYSPCLAEWLEDCGGDVSELDHNQLGTILEAWIDSEHGSIDEFVLIEDAICNGDLNNIVSGAFAGNWDKLDQMRGVPA